MQRWHALCHYEADEDIKAKDLNLITSRLNCWNSLLLRSKTASLLPQNIIEAYKPYYQDDPISYESGIKGLIKKLLRFINF